MERGRSAQRESVVTGERTRVGNLPIQRTSFVNRKLELSLVAESMRQARLVTLTGVGGVGKTRLAVQAGGEAAREFPDGVWLVELSGLRDPHLLGHTVAAALGIRDQSARPQPEVLAEFLADKHILIIWDTCEHLVDECAVVAGRLLRAAPRLRLLLTSRVRLGIPAEHVLTVEPLETSTGRRGGSAVELFAERARAAVGEFELSPDVVRLCRQLEGIPLAIELAAVRLRSMSVQEIMDRLADRFRLLSSKEHRSELRHHSLRTAIGWSHELCAPRERLLWARLSVFASTFDLEAVITVCADGSLPARGMLDELTALVDKSIVQRTDGGYRMLDTLREYGALWLAELGQEERFRRSHRDYCLGVARWFHAESWGAEQLNWYRRIQRQLPDLRAALDFCYSRPSEHRAGLDMAGALASCWVVFSRASEGRHHLGRGLALVGDDCPERARALWASGWVATVQGDYQLAEEHLNQALEVAATIGDPEAGLHAAALSASLALVLGRFTEAETLAGELISGVKPDEQRSVLFISHVTRAAALRQLGDLDGLLATVRDMHRLCDSVGEVWARSIADALAATAYAVRGQFAESTAAACAAGRVQAQLNDMMGLAMTVDGLAFAAASMGQGDRAARLLGISTTLWGVYGSSLGNNSPALAPLRLRAEQLSRQGVGDRAFEEGFRRGRDLDRDAAIAYALT